MLYTYLQYLLQDFTNVRMIVHS